MTGKALAGAFRDLHTAAFQEPCGEGALNTEPMSCISPLSPHFSKRAGKYRHVRLHVLHAQLSMDQQVETSRSAGLLHMHMRTMVGLQVCFFHGFLMRAAHGDVW